MVCSGLMSAIYEDDGMENTASKKFLGVALSHFSDKLTLQRAKNFLGFFLCPGHKNFCPKTCLNLIMIKRQNLKKNRDNNE